MTAAGGALGLGATGAGGDERSHASAASAHSSALRYVLMTATLARALALLLLCACAPAIKVTQDWDPSAKLDALRTWAWQPGFPRATGDPRLDSELLNARIKSALESGLAAKGFTAAPSPERADFSVAYHLALAEKLDARTVYRGYGPYGGWYGGATTYVDQYEVGVLLVDFIDPKAKTVIWRGAAQSRVNESRDPEERQALIQAAVDKLLAQFPPQPK